MISWKEFSNETLKIGNTFLALPLAFVVTWMTCRLRFFSLQIVFGRDQHIILHFKMEGTVENYVLLHRQISVCHFFLFRNNLDCFLIGIVANG